MFSRCAKNVHLFFIFYWLTWIANLLVGVPYACFLIAGSITVFLLYPDISDEGILSFHGEIWVYYLLGIIIMILGICLLINFIYALILCPRYCCSKRKNTVKPLEEKN
ncbi:Oidioi.mRNA.OKI2018_I69.chr1.g1663.t1.cds [Oikopleura dioica]|uniref:Oidioi.mRNA.OKI2018_I69.chr1.g1663.t1.cds n=1 Tax=Oikopleura dioica TaxID=34765 RepID=A0ABN7SXS4_OIKDI|nr:Oidioi.mRNA.OKI2018_I69.chr1.g1663.t1.cds [Oikopleura dioica]